MEKLLERINETANEYNKTKDPKQKDLWYKLIKEFSYGSYNTKRWRVSVSAINKTNDGTYVISGKRIKPV